MEIIHESIVQKAKEFVSKHKGKLATAAGLAALAGGTYYAYKTGRLDPALKTAKEFFNKKNEETVKQPAGQKDLTAEAKTPVEQKDLAAETQKLDNQIKSHMGGSFESPDINHAKLGNKIVEVKAPAEQTVPKPDKVYPGHEINTGVTLPSGTHITNTGEVLNDKTVPKPENIISKGAKTFLNNVEKTAKYSLQPTESGIKATEFLDKITGQSEKIKPVPVPAFDTKIRKSFSYGLE